MDADQLIGQVREYFRSHGAAYGLDIGTVQVDYVLNWGGFVNASYRVADARRRYHLKLAADAESLEGLAQWHRVAGLLSPYRAPHIVGWIELAGAAGLLFEHVEGDSPTTAGPLLDALLPVLARLHQDEALARELERHRSAHAPRTAAAAYHESFHARFVDDLQLIDADPPPFVSRAQRAWLHDEVARLAEQIAATTAFAELLQFPVHGDLWLNNILWQSASDWHLLDWDDLGIGDPAADLAALVGPTALDLQPLKHEARVASILDAPARERLPLLGRATLLDWVIDPLADWIDATSAPAVMDTVRPEKERVHRIAFALYERRYRARTTRR